MNNYWLNKSNDFINELRSAYLMSDFDILTKLIKYTEKDALEILERLKEKKNDHRS